MCQHFIKKTETDMGTRPEREVTDRKGCPTSKVEHHIIPAGGGFVFVLLINISSLSMLRKL